MEKQLDFFDKIDPKKKESKSEIKIESQTNTPPILEERKKEIEEDNSTCAYCDICGPMGCPRHQKRK